jgi:DNA-binding transcriptional LysR family regulator
MRRKIPSTSALAVFESAARHQSFTRAAAEQAVTQSAVCRQVAGLESFLGVKLFRRTKRGITLTEAGVSYHHQVSARLDELERDTLELMAQAGSGGTLELGVVPTFGTKWLLPRMANFQRLHPGITVNLVPRSRPFLFDDTALDATIHAGESAWPGTESQFLMRESLVAVASPALIAPHKSLKPASLRRHVLLQQSTRPYAWRHWFASLGLEVANDMVGPRMELFSMLTEAAVQGLGVALIPRFLIEDELASGRLIEVVHHAYLSDRSYSLIYPESKSDSPTLATFRSWLVDEAERYRNAAGLA